MDSLPQSVADVTDLSGIWQFTFVRAPLAGISIAGLQFDSFAAVPGCFDLLPGCFMQRGTGVYRRRVTCGGRMELACEGLGLRGLFFWDGRLIGRAEAPFSLDKFSFDAGEHGPHELCVAVNNEFDDGPGSLFRRNYDFYAHGGIFRKITIAPERPIRLEELQVIPLDPDAGVVEVTLFVAGDITDAGPAQLRWDDGDWSETLPLTEGRGKQVYRVPNRRIWSPETPELHKLTVRVKDQEFGTSFGIRKVTVAGGKLYLNGQVLKIAGTNRHDAHPDFGYAVPAEVRLRDLLMLKQRGFNCIRGCHYPQSGEFLDMCDRLGMMVWEESMGWGNRDSELSDPLFRARQLRETEKMVRKSINHPCVIMWGFMNECGSDQEAGRELLTSLAGAIRRLDPSRPVTFGSNRVKNDICLDLADIISFNVYPCWYGGSQEQFMDKAFLNDYLKDLADFASSPEYREKALIISEIGAAAFAGDHSGMRWSEEYQAELMSEAMRHTLTSERYTGIFLWQFCDTRTYISNSCQSRAGGFNRKGMVDGHRAPKLAFREVSRAIEECFPRSRKN